MKIYYMMREDGSEEMQTTYSRQEILYYYCLKAEELREESPKRTGRYAKGWAWQRTGMNRKEGSVGVTLHNKSLPGLPHLLEFGHAKRNGGRVPGKVHIAPIEKEICEEFQKEVVDKIQTII